jgi:hypothetical protein
MRIAAVIVLALISAPTGPGAEALPAAVYVPWGIGCMGLALFLIRKDLLAFLFSFQRQNRAKTTRKVRAASPCLRRVRQQAGSLRSFFRRES